MRMRFASLWISDEDKAIDFYTNKLGFKLVVATPTPFGSRFLMFSPPGGGANIVLSKPVPGVPNARVGGFTNIAWETDVQQGPYELLKARGVEFTQPPTRQPWGTEARFSDQDGHIFQLHQV